MKVYEDDPEESKEDTFDEYATRDQPAQKSFYDRYGYDERDGAPEEEEEEVGDVDDPDVPFIELITNTTNIIPPNGFPIMPNA